MDSARTQYVTADTIAAEIGGVNPDLYTLVHATGLRTDGARGEIPLRVKGWSVEPTMGALEAGFPCEE